MSLAGAFRNGYHGVRWNCIAAVATELKAAYRAQKALHVVLKERLFASALRERCPNPQAQRIQHLGV